MQEPPGAGQSRPGAENRCFLIKKAIGNQRRSRPEPAGAAREPEIIIFELKINRKSTPEPPGAGYEPSNQKHIKKYESYVFYQQRWLGMARGLSESAPRSTKYCK